MPRSRSLFASLPYDLKKIIRTKSNESPASSTDSSVLAATVANSEGFLPTQPPSPPSSDLSGSNGIASEDRNLAAACLRATLEPEADVSKAGQGRKRKRQSSGKASDKYAGHAWDCTGLVPRYSDYAQVPNNLRKYFAQRHLYFSLYDSLPLLIDDVGWYSITPQPIAAHIADRCQSDVIIDAFCGVGGNAIEFARTCERVIAIDNDPVRLRLARHNALHSGVADRIEFVLADFTEWATKRALRVSSGSAMAAVDVIFLSPPWGGPEYLSYGKTYPLSAVEPIHGEQLFQLSCKITPNLAYYLPKNVDLQELSNLADLLEQPVSDGADGQDRSREWVEIEEEWVGEKLKAVTAYFGGLVAE